MKAKYPFTINLTIWCTALLIGCAAGPTPQQVAASSAAAQQRALAAEKAQRRIALTESANGGVATAQFDLAVLILKDRDPAQQFAFEAREIAEARQWFERAADQGQVAALHNLGVIAWNIGDYGAALTWLRKADEKQYRQSRRILATMYWNGQGITQDAQKAVNYMRESGQSSSDTVVADSMQRAIDTTKSSPNVNPALPGRGGIVWQNDGSSLRFRYNPNSFAIQDRP